MAADAAPTAPLSTRSRGAVGRLWQDALALAGSSYLTAALGMLFWVVAARAVPPERLGVQTALLSAIVAPAIVVATGVGDAFSALLPRAGGSQFRIVRRSYRLLIASALLVGLISGVATALFLPDVGAPVAHALLIIVGTVLWALFVVQDSALTSMGKAHWLPLENGLVSTAKVALLPAIAVSVGGPAVVMATLAPTLLAVGVLTPHVMRLARCTTAEAPAPALERDLVPLVRTLSLSSAFTLGALTLMPFVVTATAGPAQGAVFALCLAIVQSLDFVSGAVGVSLVVNLQTLGNRGFPRVARVALIRLVLLVGAGAIAIVACSGVVLRALGREYLELRGQELIALLAVGAVMRTVFIVWSAVQRARRAVHLPLRLNAVAAVVLYALALVLCPRLGAVGAAIALLCAQVLLSLGAAAHIAIETRRISPTAASGEAS